MWYCFQIVLFNPSLEYVFEFLVCSEVQIDIGWMSQANEIA